MATFENWGDYFWDGQIDECRRNLLDIHDPVELERIERNRTSKRARELDTGIATVPQTYDLAHVQAIHAHLFQDVYEWAGQLRVVELVRPSADPDAPGHQFVPPEQIKDLAGTVFDRLGDADAIAALADRPLPERVEVLAQTYAGLNVLHPFVEGNGRAQRIFLQDLAGAAGARVDWTRMSQQNQVMAEAFTAGYEPVRQALTPCVVDLGVSTQAPMSQSARDAMRTARRAFPNLGTPGPSSSTQAPTTRSPGTRRSNSPRRDRGDDYGR